MLFEDGYLSDVELDVFVGCIEDIVVVLIEQVVLFVQLVDNFIAT